MHFISDDSHYASDYEQYLRDSSHYVKDNVQNNTHLAKEFD